MTEEHSFGIRRELAHRATDGLDVHLLWNPATDSVVVDVRDVAGSLLRVAAAPDKALDVFNHPFAYVRQPVDFAAPEEAPRWH